MKKEKKPFTKYWLKAKKFTEDKNIKEAVPMLETMIAYLAKLTDKGEKEVEGVKIDLYKERAWLSLESLGILPEYKE